MKHTDNRGRSTGRGADTSVSVSRSPGSVGAGRRLRRAARLGWAFVSVFALVSLVLGLAVLPAALLWMWHLTWPVPFLWARLVLHGVVFVPTYFVFACTLMALAALATRIVGWRTPRDAVMRLDDWDWPLFDWLRYVIVTQIVRVFAGTFFRGTPLWTLYIRLNGARIGRGVFVNTLSIMDHNLLEIGAHSIVGSDVHLSGHTVEHGVVTTATLRIGRRVTIGSQSVIGVGSEIGDDCAVGALSFVPKYAKLSPGRVYAGIPVQPLDPA